MTVWRIIACSIGAPASGRHAGGTPAVRWWLRRYSPVGRLQGEGLGDLGLPAVAVGEQLILVVEQFLAGLGGELEIRPLNDRIDRAGLLAIAAIDAFGHGDVLGCLALFTVHC